MSVQWGEEYRLPTMPDYLFRAPLARDRAVMAVERERYLRELNSTRTLSSPAQSKASPQGSREPGRSTSDL